MPESDVHKRIKKKEAGKSGKTEVPIKGGQRLDASTRKRAKEIERSGTKNGLEKAAKRLKDSGKKQKVLIVPAKDINKGVDAMKEVGTSGTVRNPGKTKRRWVGKKRKK